MKELRLELDRIQNTFKAIPSHEVEIANYQTKSAFMWMGKLKGIRGAENPYPESMNSENTKVEPAQDITEESYLDLVNGIIAEERDKGGEFNTTMSNSAVRTCKLLREKTQNVIDKFLSEESKPVSGSLEETCAIQNIYTYLQEAKMWLGVAMANFGRAVVNHTQTTEGQK